MPDKDLPAEDHQPLGLRERKKQLTHRTIADAAFAMASERGLDSVTIDQIAERAFVSPRTVSNYFASKEAAIVAAHNNAPVNMAAGLDERPVGEAPLQSLRAVLTTSIRNWTAEQMDALKAKNELVARFPALHPLRMAQFEELEAEIHQAIALRTGTDPELAMRPRLIAGAATAAVKAAICVWDSTGGDADVLADLVDQALADLGAGLGADT